MSVSLRVQEILARCEVEEKLHKTDRRNEKDWQRRKERKQQQRQKQHSTQNYKQYSDEVSSIDSKQSNKSSEDGEANLPYMYWSAANEPRAAVQEQVYSFLDSDLEKKFFDESTESEGEESDPSSGDEKYEVN
ncbi:unnamed protein product [Didymodactylos carnosus]|uniref:Uncharacterized protein n=1 Tax=Didymodactylos carnosus TaxID=1234261 RepID=A0A8S2NY86_9BILA|nr:unnamed protein product [Didymodactylos carnosus]CAF4024302.1 unnamed protein product [Didymodactylos carnosus]